MNIIQKLTLKHMALNKKRTIVTILGIIISVAMFSAVTTFASSFMKMMQIEVQEWSGKWHVSYPDISKDDISTIKKDDNTKDVITLYNFDIATLDNNSLENNYSPFLSINTLDQYGFKETLPLSEGEYPKNDQEIVFSKELLRDKELDLKIGDTITLYGGLSSQMEAYMNDGNNDINIPSNSTMYTYTITGFVTDSYYRNYYIPAYNCFTYTTTNAIEQSIGNKVYVELYSVTNDIYDDSEELAKTFGIDKENISYNDSLVYYGVSNNSDFITAMYTIVFIIMAVIMVGAIALIYNAFAISLSERSKYLGMIASIGATRNQKRQSVFFEGFILAIVSIPLGVLVGIGGLGLTFLCINPIIKNISDIAGFPLTISIEGIILAVVFAIVTILISTYIPARRASKISPIEAIRSSNDIKLTNKTIKTNRLTKWIFGFEGELAVKNLKRNKKRYRVTLISLIVSVILFLSVSGFTYYFKNAFVMANSEINYDASISVNDSEQELIKELSQVKNADEIAIDKKIYLYTPSPAIEDFNPDIISFLKEQEVDVSNQLSLTVYVHCYNSDYFDTYCKENNITLDNDTVIINKTNIIGMNRKFKEGPLLSHSSGPISFTSYIDEDKDFTITFNNVVKEDTMPLGSSQPRSYDFLNLFVNEETFAKIEAETGYDAQTTVYLKTSNNDALDKEITDIMSKYDDLSYYENIAKTMDTVNQMLLIVNVFIYGFIILISLISIANIFNTITTSVALRTKEFAMLKSVGMTPKAFNKMIYFESLFYGLNTLLYGIPLGLGIMYWIYHSMVDVFSSPFSVPISSFIIVIIAVFVIVGSTLLFSVSKVKKQNIIDGLKGDNI